jgi:hypothetical protein
MATEKITVEVSREFLFEACALVYSKWTKAYDALKAERKATDDGSTDWAEFHGERLANANKDEAKLRKLVDEAGPLSALAIKRD